MNNIIEINTGEIKTGKAGMILKSNSIGSCIAIIAFDLTKKIGAIAHIMLPGRSPKQDTLDSNRYSADALDKLINQMCGQGSNIQDIEVCLVGGANVLKRKKDTICKDNADSVVKLLKEKQIPIRAVALGGTKRRSVVFNIQKKSIFYTEGDEEEKVLLRMTDNLKYEDESKKEILSVFTEISKQNSKFNNSDINQNSQKNTEENSILAASLNIMEDLEIKKTELEHAQIAYQNIIEDMELRSKELEENKIASLNFMEDLARTNELLYESIENEKRFAFATNIAVIQEKEKSKKLERTYEKLKKAHQKLKKAQAAVVQSGKLAAVGQLAAGVAHEINNPLATILTFASNLKKLIKREENFSQKDIFIDGLDEIREAVSRGRIITDGLLSFSRQEGPEKLRIDLKEVIKDSILLTNAKLRRANVIVDNNFKTSQFIYGNANQLQQVIINMLLNASQAMTNGGKIKLSTEIIDSFTILKIEDTGDGISKKYLKQIFEPFFTTKQAGVGTGLGLSICHGIIEEHNGTILAESVVGKGTIFTIKLPIFKD